jgi:hypothetical protein
MASQTRSGTLASLNSRAKSRSDGSIWEDDDGTAWPVPLLARSSTSIRSSFSNIPNMEMPNDINSDFIIFTFMDCTSRSILVDAASSTLRFDMAFICIYLLKWIHVEAGRPSATGGFDLWAWRFFDFVWIWNS